MNLYIKAIGFEQVDSDFEAQVFWTVWRRGLL